LTSRAGLDVFQPSCLTPDRGCDAYTGRKYIHPGRLTILIHDHGDIVITVDRDFFYLRAPSPPFRRLLGGLLLDTATLLHLVSKP